MALNADALHAALRHSGRPLAPRELHRDELMADWELAVSGESPYKIDPL